MNAQIIEVKDLKFIDSLIERHNRSDRSVTCLLQVKMIFVVTPQRSFSHYQGC